MTEAEGNSHESLRLPGGGDANGERDAFRAAGQAYTAAALGLPIKHVSVNGIVLDWPANLPPSRDQSRSELATGLGGIAAADRYAWGLSVDRNIVFDYDAADEQSRTDFDNADSLSSEIDPRDEHRVMADAWDLASALVSDDDV